MKRRAISFLTALALCLSLCPMRALAADDTDPGPADTFFAKDYKGTETYVVNGSIQLDTQGGSYTITGQTAVRVPSRSKLYLTTGTIESTGGAGIEVQTEGFLRIDDPGMTVIGTTYGLDISSGTTVRLSGGTFQGGERAIQVADGNYRALLGNGCAYFDGDENPIQLYDGFDGNGDPTQTTVVAGKTTVKVKECTEHSCIYKPDTYKPGTYVTHSGICQYCGAPAEPGKCTFSFNKDGYAKCDHCNHEIQITITTDSDGLVYDGEDKTVFVAVVLDRNKPLTQETDYTYTVEPSPRTINAGDITNVDSYTVTVTGKSYGGTYTRTFSITQAEPKITWNDDISVPVTVDYDGNPVDEIDSSKVIITAQTDSDVVELRQHLYFSYRIKDSNADFMDGLPTDAGTYEIRANLPATQNYTAASSPAITLTINKIDPFIKKDDGTFDVPHAIEDLEYNRTAQELVTRGTVWEGAVVLFATSENGPWSTDIPTGTNAGKYEVWYKVEGNDNFDYTNAYGKLEPEIQRKEITPVVELEYYTTVYDGGYKEPKVIAVKDGDTVLPISEYTVTYSNNINVGKANDNDTAKRPTVIVADAGGGNYAITTVNTYFDITEKDQDGLNITGQRSGILYGDVFTLGTTGGSGNGKVTWEIIAVKDGSGDNIDSSQFDKYATVDTSGTVTVKGVGKVTVQATRSDADTDGNYKKATAEWTFTSAPKPVTAVVTADSKTYDGNANATIHVGVAQSDLAFSTDTISITGLSGTFRDGPDAGTGKIVTITGTAAYGGADKDKYIVTIPTTATADITKAATEIKTEPTWATLTYNRTEQALLTKGAEAAPTTEVAQDGETVVVEYALSANGPWDTAVPKRTDAGTYQVWYRVKETNNYFGTAAAMVEVTIDPKKVTPAVTLDSDSYVYTGSEIKPTVTVKESANADAAVIPASEYTVTYSNNVNVGTASGANPPTVTIKNNPDGNYMIDEVSVYFTITNLSAELTSPPKAIANLVYNGQEQKLVTPGTASGGTLMYALQTGNTEPAESEYKTTIPTGEDAKQYTVYYKVVGDSNHASIGSAFVTVTIQPKQVLNPVITLTLPTEGYTYGGDQKEPAVTVKDGETTIAGPNDTKPEYTVTYSNNTDAGTATVHITDINGGNYTVNGEKTFEIKKAVAKFDEGKAPEAENLTYSGKAQKLVKAGTSNDGTVAYSQDGTNFSLNIPEGTDAGSYTVWCKVIGDRNHTDSAPQKVANVKISPKTVSSPKITLSQSSYVYDGLAKEPAVTVTYVEGTETITIPASEYTVEYSNNINVGGPKSVDGSASGTEAENKVPTVTIKDKPGGNYTVSGATTFTITNASAVLTNSPQAVANLIYNGQEQKLVTAGTATGGTLKYAVKTDGTEPTDTDYQNTIPTGTGADTYTVYYKVVGDSNHADTVPTYLTVVIQPKTVTNPEITLPSETFTYDGNAKMFSGTITVKDGNNTIAGPGDSNPEYTVTYTNNINAGTATVHIVDKDGGNYIVSGSKTFEIAKATASFTTEPTAQNPTYSGKAQTLIKAGVANGGTAVYALDDENGPYSEALPTGINAGDYTVYAKVRGDANHEDSDPTQIPNVKIDPKSVTPVVTCSPGTFPYDGTEKTPNIIVTDDDGVAIPASEYTVEFNDQERIAVGTYKVTVKDKDGGNYEFNTPIEKTFNIVSADQAPLSIVTDRVTAYFGETFRLSAVGGTGKGALKWSIKSADANVAEIDETNGVVTVKGVGSFTVEVYREGTSDNSYKDSDPVSMTFKAEPRPVTAVVTAASREYDGTKGADLTVTVPGTGLTITGVTGTFSDPNVGTGKTVIIDSSGVTASGDNIGNYEIAWPATTTADITPKEITPTVTVAAGPHTYTGSAIEPDVTVTFTGTPTPTDADYTVTYSNNINAGEATVTVRNVTGGNYMIYAATNFTINKANPTVTAPVGKTGLTYTGNPMALVYSGSTSHGQMMYSLVQSGPYYADIPTGTNAGDYTVYYKVPGNSNFEGYEVSTPIDVTIAKADQTPLTIIDKPSAPIYYGAHFTLSTSGGSGNGVVTWTSEDSNVASINSNSGYVEVKGTGTVKITATKDGGTNYNNATATWTFTTVQAAAQWESEPKAVSDLTYTGGEQQLVTAGSTVGSIGKVEYRLDQASWQETPPTETNAGTYTVWYRVAGNASYTGIDEKSVQVTIAPKAVNDPTVTYISGTADFKVEFSDANVTYTATRVNDNSPGIEENSFKVKVTLTSDNYVFENGAREKTYTATAVSADTSQGGTQAPSGSSGNTGGTGSNTAPSTETSSPQTTVRDGTASTVLDSAAGSKLANEAVANQSENVVIKPEITGNVTKTEVSLPASAVSRIGNETDASLTVSTPIADVTIPNGALDALSSAGGTVSIAAEQVDNTIVLSLTANGRDVGDLPGGLTLTVPVEDAGPGTVAVLVYEDGTREIIRKSVAGDDGVRIPLNGSATVEIVDNSREFADVPAENWAADAVAFASAHEMFNGTSETTFSPEKSMSRAMLATVLYNLEGQPDQSLTGAFSDINSDTWYAESVSWAAENGIVTGYNNGAFGANDPITREQLAVMLWRYAGNPTADEQTLNFTDADQVSGYAAEALCWAVENGILNGYGNGRVDPAGLATRAQAAQMLKNFIENIY